VRLAPAAERTSERFRSHKRKREEMSNHNEKIEEPTPNGVSHFEPALNVDRYDPDQYDFVWSADYSAFRAIKCRWTDEASYAAFQAHD